MGPAEKVFLRQVLKPLGIGLIQMLGLTINTVSAKVDMVESFVTLQGKTVVHSHASMAASVMTPMADPWLIGATALKLGKRASMASQMYTMMASSVSIPLQLSVKRLKMRCTFA